MGTAEPDESSFTISLHRLARWARTSIVAIAVVASVVGALGASHLRPANDDYWHAVQAQLGLLGSIREWWLTVSGDVVAMASNTLFNGLPLRYLPWPLTSAVPFLVTFVVIGAVGLLLLGSVTDWRLRGILRAISTWLVLSFLWWVFLWTPLIEDETPRRAIALALTHWQNLNTAYVLPPVLLLAAWTVLGRSSIGSRSRLLMSAFLGLGAGMSGPVIGTTTVLWLTIAGIVIAMAASPISRALVVQAIAVGGGAVVGLGVAYLSPGSQARKMMISPTFELSVSGISGLTIAFPQAMSDLASAFMHSGTLVVFAVVTGFVALSVENAPKRSSAVLMAGAASLLLSFAFAYAVVNRLSEFFVGHGFWHVATVQAFVYLSLVLISTSAGLLLATVRPGRITVATAVLAVIGALVGLGSVEVATNSMTGRQSQWDVGPAPIEGVFDDIEDPSGWQMRFWRELTTLRDTPNRG